jgi:hypothetical protein
LAAEPILPGFFSFPREPEKPQAGQACVDSAFMILYCFVFFYFFNIVLGTGFAQSFGDSFHTFFQQPTTVFNFHSGNIY